MVEDKMRKQPTIPIELGRVTEGPLGSEPFSGCQGAYVVPSPFSKYMEIELRILCADGEDDIAEGWEHVSVSLSFRTPTWGEMDWVKRQFWENEEAAFQLHPAASHFINNHPHCLHIWKHKQLICPTPPGIFVGKKDADPEEIERLRRKLFK
jgi:hypothetical protein